MKNSILVVIVAYYPDKGLLHRNIDAYIDDVDQILIWKNTPDDNYIESEFLNVNKIVVKGENANKGISYALNYAWKYAKKNGFRYLMTMDQDTVWHNFSAFRDDVLVNRIVPTGIWAPGNEVRNTIPYDKTNFVITSGMLVSIDVLDRLQGWDERFKVDGVDNDFCCHASHLGVPIYTVNSCHIEQRCGSPEMRSFMGMKFEVHNYSASRLYEIYKNHIITFRKYSDQKILRKSWMHEWCYYRIFYILFEKDVLIKLIAVMRGIIVGYTRRLDK